MSKQYHWKTLYDGMMSNLCERIEAHNKQYPKPQFRASHARRLKKSDINTLHNLVKAWCKQTARRINSGQTVITNAFGTNNEDAQGGPGKGHKTNTARYLGKLAFCGFLLGEKVSNQDEARYRCQFTQHGRGFGMRPIKKFHGTCHDYEVLLSPALVPLGCLPAGVSFDPLDAFFSPKMDNSPRPKGESSTLIIAKTIKPGNKEIFQKESPEEGEPSPRAEVEKALARLASGDAPTDDKETDGKRKEIANPGEGSKLPGQESTEISAAPILRGSQIAQDAEKQGIFSRLFLAGHELTAYAVLLVQCYLKNIAVARGRQYVPAEIERGVASAVALLQRIQASEVSARVDVYVHTIDVMAEWIRRKPGAWVKPPGQWFRPGETANIEGAVKRFYRPHREQAASWRDASILAGKVETARKQADAATATLSGAHELAALLKRHMMHLHPTDGRLRTANLDAWAATLRLMARKDKKSPDELKKVIVWLFKSEHKSAIWWREEVGGFGIRSATGFRRHYGRIHDQMYSTKNQKTNEYTR